MLPRLRMRCRGVHTPSRRRSVLDLRVFRDLRSASAGSMRGRRGVRLGQCGGHRLSPVRRPGRARGCVRSRRRQHRTGVRPWPLVLRRRLSSGLLLRRRMRRRRVFRRPRADRQLRHVLSRSLAARERCDLAIRPRDRRRAQRSRGRAPPPRPAPASSARPLVPTRGRAGGRPAPARPSTVGDRRRRARTRARREWSRTRRSSTRGRSRERGPAQARMLRPSPARRKLSFTASLADALSDLGGR